MFIKFKVVEYCSVLLLLFYITFNIIISSANEIPSPKCKSSEDVSANNTFENGDAKGKFIRIQGKTTSNFRSIIADIAPKKNKAYWIGDAIDRKTSETETRDIDVGTVSLGKDDVKIAASTMLDESNMPTIAPFRTESSSVSSQSNMVSKFEQPIKDLNATFQKRIDGIPVAADKIFENNTNSVTMGATSEDIPSFREWAEKHLAAEEKERGDDNHTNAVGNGKVPKMRNKNYASPDCGAKLLNANPEAKAAGSFLSSSRDEYLLSPCNSKIWFVVELCEAVQLKKIELANFELFSSSPREFSVSISDRYPSRDWSLIGQFTAKDEKSVQSFSVKPRHFTKYIKVEFHSHYGREHFCPISLFRVYGTSEFEVLEVDGNDALGVGPMGSEEFEPNAQNYDLDSESDDDDINEPIIGESGRKSAKNSESSNNLFGSARDVVINIVKKAAEALGNVPHHNQSDLNVIKRSNVSENNRSEIISQVCVTPKYVISCPHCQRPFFHRVYHLASCCLQELELVLRNRVVRTSLLRSNACATSTRCDNDYIIRLLKGEMVIALCHLLAIETGSAEENTTAALLSGGVLHPSPAITILGNASVRGFADKNLGADWMETGPFLAADVPGGVAIPSQLPVTKFDQLSGATVASAAFSPTDALELTKLPINERAQVDSGSVVGHIKPTKTMLPESPLHVHVDPSVSSAGSSSVSISSPPPVENGDHHRAKIVRSDNDETSNKDTGPVIEPGHGPEISDDSMAIDSLISEWETSEGAHPAQSSAAPVKPAPQKDSVFVRLANRIKTLERNMSLSGQYLEELSRRYKKQVEDMQRVLTEAAEDRQKSVVRETKLSQEVASLDRHVAELTAAVDALVAERESWGYKALMVGEHSLILFLEVAIFIFIVCVCRGIPSVEISKRKFSLDWSRIKQKVDDDKNAPQVVLKRRQSFDDLTSYVKPCAKRRPSEEALKMDGATHQDLLIYETHRSSKTGRKRRKRKELLLKSNANAINLEIGCDMMLKRQTNANPTNAPLSRSASTSEIDDHCWSRIDYNGGSGGNGSGVGGRRILANSINGGNFKENVSGVDENEWPSYVQTATSARTKRLSNKFNGKTILSPVYDVSSDQDSSVPSTPVKEKKVNSLKKIVKKFF